MESNGTIHSSCKLSLQKRSNARATKLARDDHYGDATRALISHRYASLEDKDALNDLLQRHPQFCLPESSATTPPALTVDTLAITSSLRAFPRGLSPGFS